ncbi:hypothetical protein J4455_04945 [Candidatus Woesearchaeota archaeon]|nr:hypothetical protein [Candidatus Woesearchaeota archaeon]
MKFTFKIEKRHLYILTLFLIGFGAVIFVLAYGTNNPSEFGHTYTEVQGLPNPSTIWTRDNDGISSGLDADRIDSQDISFKDMGTNSPKICVNNGICTTQQTACPGQGSISKRYTGCSAAQCASNCNSFCQSSATCQWGCNGNLYPECSGGTIAQGSESCTSSSSGACSDGDTCECECVSPGQFYLKEIKSQQLFCATMIQTS